MIDYRGTLRDIFLVLWLPESDFVLLVSMMLQNMI